MDKKRSLIKLVAWLTLHLPSRILEFLEYFAAQLQFGRVLFLPSTSFKLGLVQVGAGVDAFRYCRYLALRIVRLFC